MDDSIQLETYSFWCNIKCGEVFLGMQDISESILYDFDKEKKKKERNLWCYVQEATQLNLQKQLQSFFFDTAIAVTTQS